MDAPDNRHCRIHLEGDFRPTALPRRSTSNGGTCSPDTAVNDTTACPAGNACARSDGDHRSLSTSRVVTDSVCAVVPDNAFRPTRPARRIKPPEVSGVWVTTVS